MLDSYTTRWRDWLNEHPTVGKVVSWVRDLLPPVNYITIHYAYFITVILASSLIFWGSSVPFGSLGYVDSLFLVTSALTCTGLSTKNLSELTTWQQVQLWFLLMIGSPIWVSFWTVMVRRRAFERRFKDIVRAERERRGARLIRAPNLLQMLSKSKENAGRNASPPSMPGLGPRIPFRPGTPTSTHRLSDIEPVTSAQLSASPPGSSAFSAEAGVGRGGEKADLTIPQRAGPSGEDPKGRISFAGPASPHQQGNGEPHTSAYQRGNHPISHPTLRRPSDAQSSASAESGDFLMHWKKFLGKHNVTRSGQFHDLSEEQREHLGGCEYRALKILSWTVPLYSAVFQFLGAVALACWIATRRPEVPATYGVNPWWTGIFYSVSAFNNGGYTIVDDSVASFVADDFVLVVVGLLILAGNTAYPLFLRLILWSALKILQLTTEPTSHAEWKETLEFILKYPRRVYTTLFPSRATWWLVGVLLVTNFIDWVAFEVLNIGNPTVEGLAVGRQIMAGLFQAVSVRAAGFTVISISALYIGTQVLYLIMMYISVYPVVMTMRNSNVYEERSLGIYDDGDPLMEEQEQEANPFIRNQEPQPSQILLRRRTTAAMVGKQMKRATTFQGVGVRPPQNDEETSRISYLGQQIRGQLAHDLWWLVLAILIIVIIETDHFLRDPVTYSVFNILFESTSAYACVGLSLGLPDAAYSFAGGLFAGSKLVLCLVMLRGRHRGLPVAIDRAVRLPGDKLRQEEEEDAKIRRSKTMHRLMSREG